MDCWHKTQCILFAHIMHTIRKLTAYFACIPITNLEHLHQLVMGPERPAVDKLLAVEVLVPDVKAAEDLNLRPIVTSPAASVADSPLNAPHQPSDLTLTELIVLPVWRR